MLLARGFSSCLIMDNVSRISLKSPTSISQTELSCMDTSGLCQLLLSSLFSFFCAYFSFLLYFIYFFRFLYADLSFLFLVSFFSLLSFFYGLDSTEKRFIHKKNSRFSPKIWPQTNFKGQKDKKIILIGISKKNSKLLLVTQHFKSFSLAFYSILTFVT